MGNHLRIVAGILALVAAMATAPETAAAQCQWGCTCLEDACGCNQNGNGSRCDAGGTGCVVSGCDDTRKKITFAADGSIVELAANHVTDVTEDVSPASLVAETSAAFRWEFVAEGRSVARHCNGLILARHFDPRTAADLREQTRTLSI